MRFILGVIVGAVLLAGSAYVHDTMRARPGVAGAPQPYVNWDQVFAAFGRI
ncbi:MAG: hypothetical protein HY659_00195 [Rhizobiales bacterium]|nr:hypothetical protein [Hyphomicrobiales bacterium]